MDFSGQRLGHPPGKILRRMLDQLRHRGPDDRGEEKFVDESDGIAVYLGHQRLSIIDLTVKGHQPMANDTQSIWISTNSEIYNFRELREELRSKYDFHSNSDTEVLLKAYEEWGVDCLQKLRGMFAFAIWDSTRKTLFLARDRLGIKPLYYFSSANCFLFASELRAVKASGIPETRLNATGLFHYLTFGSLLSPETLLEAIKELEPAHYLLVSHESFEKVKYWDPAGKSHEFSQDETGPALAEAVKLRLVSDVPLGAFLSGGIDSSAVATLMKQHSPADLNTLSVVFKEREFDESEYSTRVARQLETRHQTLELSDSELLDSLSQAIAAMDQPTVDGINTWFIARSARQAGWKVALSGAGGDELFGGYDSFRLLPRLAFLEKNLAALPRSWTYYLANLLKHVLKNSDRTAKFIHLMQNKKSGCHTYFLLRALFCEDRIHDLFQDKSLFKNEIRKNFERTLNICSSIASLHPLKQISYLELTHYLANTLLRDTDMMSMAHGLEVRVPLIDHLLVEKLFSLPAQQQFAGPHKALLVRSLPQPLPEKVTLRKKMGFTLPFETWMRKNLRNEVESVLNEPSAPLRDFISESSVQQVWKDFLEHRVSWSRPWALYVLKKWLLHNPDNAPMQ